MRQEASILRDGAGLSGINTLDARRIGVNQPQRVKLLKVPEVPQPKHPALAQAIEATQLISPLTAGLTLRFGIFIRADCWDDRHLICHELVHTAQYERLGGFRPFLTQYLSECLTIGYPEAPLEQEAIITANCICV